MKYGKIWLNISMNVSRWASFEPFRDIWKVFNSDFTAAETFSFNMEQKNLTLQTLQNQAQFYSFYRELSFTRRVELVLLNIWYRKKLFPLLRVLFSEESLKNSFPHIFCNENTNTEPEKSWSAEPLSDLLRKLIRLFGHLSNARYTPCPHFFLMRGYWGYFVD